MKAKYLSVISLSALIMSGAATQIFGQTTSDTNQRQVAQGNNLYCAGYISKNPIVESPEVVGGEQEQEQYTYKQGDYIYINAGTQQGVKIDDRYAITRPRGRMRSPFSRKGDLGVFVEELGAARIINVKPQVSVAFIETSCENVLLGDLLVPSTTRVAPDEREEVTLDRFKDPSGKATGRIVLARNGQEFVSRDQIVYIDLGSEDGVKAGDYLTIYRPLGKGGVVRLYDFDKDDEEIVRPEDPGFESQVFRGGKFDNQAPRKTGADAQGKIATTPAVKKRRPAGLRKIVGEATILSVQGSTATVVITRTAQEINTGDYVELQ
ncbi:MAG: hypothetical protein ABI954_04435 [Pyrinomonadaceae bacterium]